MALVTSRKDDPRDMVLAFGVPTTLGEFADDLRLGPARDFASHLVWRAAGRASKADYYARHHYAPVVACIDEVVDTVRECQVEVVRRLDLETLARLFERFAVVSVAAHWRGDALHEEDVLDWPALGDRLLGATGGVLADLRRGLSEQALAALAGAAQGEPADRARVSREIGDLFRRAPAGSGSAVPHDPELEGFRNRGRFDESMAGAVRPGNRVELRDGLHPVEAVAGCVPAGFAGVLDLTICNSVFLAEAIKRDRTREQFLAVTNRDPTEFRFRLLLYKHAVRLVARRGMSYLDALLELREGLLSTE